jgi:hypothetical protein
LAATAIDPPPRTSDAGSVARCCERGTSEHPKERRR